MAKKKLAKKTNLQMIIVLALAIMIIGSIFLPWMIASYSSSLVGEKTDVTYYGHEFLDALLNGKDSIDLKDPEAGIIYSWTKADKTQAGANALMFAVAGALAVGVVMAASSLLGLLTKMKVFKLVNKICGLLLLVIGIIGVICGFSILNQVHKLDLGMLSGLASVQQIVIAPFVVAAGGLAATLVSIVVKK